MIVLDTHAWLWLVGDPGRLSAAATDAIRDADRLLVSTISAWEIGTLVRRRRIALDRPVHVWVGDSLAALQLTALAPDTPTALLAAGLEGDRFPGDPGDRLIYATAVQSGARLLTRDERLRSFDAERTVW